MKYVLKFSLVLIAAGITALLAISYRMGRPALFDERRAAQAKASPPSISGNALICRRCTSGGFKSIFYSLNLGTREVTELCVFDGRVATAAAYDAERGNLVVGGFYEGRRSFGLDFYQLRSPGVRPKLMKEVEFYVDTHFSIALDDETGLFFIASAIVPVSTRSRLDSYALYGNTGETVIYSYDPAHNEFYEAARVDNFLEVFDVSPPGELDVSYFSDPSAIAFGSLDLSTGKVRTTWSVPLIVYPLRGVAPPNRYDKGNRAFCYYHVLGENAYWLPIENTVFVRYFAAGRKGAVLSLGEHVRKPVLYSERNDALVFLRVTEGRREELTITVKPLDGISECSFELPPPLYPDKPLKSYTKLLCVD